MQSLTDKKWREDLAHKIDDLEIELEEMFFLKGINFAEISLNFNPQSTGPKFSTKVYISSTKSEDFFIEKNKVISSQQNSQKCEV